MKNSDQVVSELTSEVAIAILLEQKAEDSEMRAKLLIETLLCAAEKGSDRAESAHQSPVAA